ncbi:MAG TPA: hypothetical protein VGK41_07530 [Solirubrobacterales bacterium]
MKFWKMLGLAVLSAMVLQALGFGTASATTLEVGGIPRVEAITLTASLDPESTLLQSTTGGALSNTCKESHLHDTTQSPYTGTNVTGGLSSLSLGKCDPEGVTVHKPGNLYVEWNGGTNGDVFSEEAEVTVPTTSGITANCKTGTGTTIGELTGTKTGHATMHIKAVLNCGFLLPSSTWSGTYIVTSPTGLGVTDKSSVPSTTLEVGGSPKAEAITTTGSLDPESTALLSTTGGSLSNTCKESHLHGATESPFTGTKVTGALSSLTFGKCDPEGIKVHKAGNLYVEYTSGTNGDVFSEEAEITVPTTAGINANCKTVGGTTIGELTGTKTGHATVHLKAVLNCGFLLPSSTLSGTYLVTSPTGLGVTT